MAEPAPVGSNLIDTSDGNTEILTPGPSMSFSQASTIALISVIPGNTLKRFVSKPKLNSSQTALVRDPDPTVNNLIVPARIFTLRIQELLQLTNDTNYNLKSTVEEILSLEIGRLDNEFGTYENLLGQINSTTNPPSEQIEQVDAARNNLVGILSVLTGLRYYEEKYREYKEYASVHLDLIIPDEQQLRIYERRLGDLDDKNKVSSLPSQTQPMQTLPKNIDPDAMPPTDLKTVLGGTYGINWGNDPSKD